LASVLGSLADALDRISRSFRAVSASVEAGATGTEAGAIGAEGFLGALQESGLGARGIAGLPGAGGLAALGLLAPAARNRLSQEFQSRPAGTGERLSVSVPVTINGSPMLTPDEIAGRFQGAIQAEANKMAAETEGNQ